MSTTTADKILMIEKVREVIEVEESDLREVLHGLFDFAYEHGRQDGIAECADSILNLRRRLRDHHES